ncbi:unnamed protein product [Malus baccata var. baccata]
MPDCTETTSITAKGSRSSISTEYRLFQPPLFIAILLYLQKTQEIGCGVKKHSIYPVVRLEKAPFLYSRYSAEQSSQSVLLRTDNMAQQGMEELVVQLYKAMDLSAVEPENVKRLTREVGTYMAMEDPVKARGVLRVRLLIDSTEPLVSGCWLRKEANRDTWVEFCYERLQDFCYRCGRLRHVNTDCTFEATKAGAAGFGEWLKAPPVRDVEEGPKVMMTGTSERRRAGAARVPATHFRSLGITELEHTTESSADSEKERGKMPIQGERSAHQFYGRKKWQMRLRAHRYIEEPVGTTNQLNWLIPQSLQQSIWGSGSGCYPFLQKLNVQQKGLGMQSVIIHEINEEATTVQIVADGGSGNDQDEDESLVFPPYSHSGRNKQKREKEHQEMEISQSPQKKGRVYDGAFAGKDAGSDTVVRALHGQIRHNRPSMIFLSETKMKDHIINGVRRRMGLTNGFNVSPMGRAGSLCLWWEDSLEVNIIFSSKHVIDAQVKSGASQQWVRVTGIYGTAYRSEKAEFWGWMKNHFTPSDMPWLCGGGDFNEFMWDHEKSGGAPMLFNRPRYLEDFINHSNLMDLGFNGPPYTWRGMRNGDLVEERLDRGLINKKWQDIWPHSTTMHGTVMGFDHYPVIIKTELNGMKGRKLFRKLVDDHFLNVFKSGGPRDWGNLLEGIHSRVIVDMNLALMESVSMEEIKEAALQMGGFKAPGPDGFQGIFYRSFWDIVVEDVNNLVRSFLRDEISPTEINNTHIMLLPKIPNPVSVSHFRPISLCNYSYKVLSKVLANRLKILLPQIISPTQNAFVAGRQIQDNIGITHEVVEWDFLEATMEKMGFCSQWRKLIMGCVTSVKFAVILNGHPGNKFAPSRGLRQGDPLSPYLFLLIGEVLSRLIQDAVEKKSLDGIKLGITGSVLSHIFFADDMLIFLRANEKNCRNLVNLLKAFCDASGQEVNLQKSNVFFGANTSVRVSEELGSILGMPVLDNPGSYLGVSACWRCSKKQGLAYVKGRIIEKLQGWKQCTLSKAGKEVLIKAVVQAVPAYPMNLFKFPAMVCDELDTLVARFWWGNGGGDNKIHWVSKKVLGLLKNLGGLGLRNFMEFNDALLAKQCWRLLCDPSSLWARVMKARYFPNCSFLEAKKGGRASWAWSSLLSGRDLLIQGTHWQIMGGQDVRVWVDRWLPSIPSGRPSPLGEVVVTRNLRVSSLICPQSRDWDLSFLIPFLSVADQGAIEGTPIGDISRSDRLIRAATKNGGGLPLPPPVLSACVMMNLLSICSSSVLGFKLYECRPGSWQCPVVVSSSPPFTKINVDASWFKTSCSGFVGVVLRDAEAHFIAAARYHIRAPCVAAVEAMALLRGCELGASLGLSEVILESDSSEAISCLSNSIENGSWEAIPTLARVKLFGEAFQNCRWSWVPRTANMAADALTSRDCAELCDVVWVDRPPSSLVFLLNNDGLPCPH